MGTHCWNLGLTRVGNKATGIDTGVMEIWVSLQPLPEALLWSQSRLLRASPSQDMKPQELETLLHYWTVLLGPALLISSLSLWPSRYACTGDKSLAASPPSPSVGAGGTGKNGLFHCLTLWSLDSSICVSFSHHYLHQSYLNSESYQCKVNTDFKFSNSLNVHGYVWS